MDVASVFRESAPCRTRRGDCGTDHARGTIAGYTWQNPWRRLPALRPCGMTRARVHSGMMSVDTAASRFPFAPETVLEGLPDGFQAFDREWRYVYLNRRAEQMLGREREELLGNVCWDEYPEAVGTEFHRRHLEAVATGETVVFEHLCPRENTWVELSLHPYPGGLGAFSRDISGRKRAEEALLGSLDALRRSEQQYHALFDQVQSAVVLFDDAARYVDANPAACDLFGLPRETLAGRSVLDFAPPGTAPHLKEAWRAFRLQGEQSGEFTLLRPDGGLRTLEYRAKAHVRPGVHLAILRDTAQRREAEERASLLLADLQAERDTLDTVNRIGRLLSAELNLERLVQAATDAATELTGAQFGAFFYNNVSPDGEDYLLYTISGAPREAFSRFPHPRATPLFGPTFRGEEVIRSGDVTKDPRYGRMAPHHGMPGGHLPVRSYLAVPVYSRSGEVLGGLFFGHAEKDVFTERAERNLVVLVAQIAVAMDNARLYQKSLQAEERLRANVEALRESEKLVRTMAENSTQGLAMMDGRGFCTYANRAWLRMTGYTDEEIKSEPLHYLVHHHYPDGRPYPMEECPIDRALPENFDVRAHEDVFFRKDGTTFPVLVAASPIFKEGRPVATVIEIRDVTEAKRVESQRRAFIRDVLSSMTEGRLHLCDTAADLPAPLAPAPLAEPVSLSQNSIRTLRRQVQTAAQLAQLPAERQNDLLTSVGETAMNAVVHGSGGVGQVFVDEARGVVQVWVTDKGMGISEEVLHRATLEKGYSTAGTFGHGFWLMLRTADRLYLLTGPQGTTVVQEQGRSEPEPQWLTQ